jgi:hypothetical protein
MPTERTAMPAPTKVSPEEVRRILNATDWDEYWREVSKQVSQEVDAYELARAKSLQSASRLVFI